METNDFSTQCTFIMSIADILRFAPRNTNLFCSLHGNVYLDSVDVLNRIHCHSDKGEYYTFSSDGKLMANQQYLLFCNALLQPWEHWQTALLPTVAEGYVTDVYDGTVYHIIEGKMYDVSGREVTEYQPSRLMFSKPYEIKFFHEMAGHPETEPSQAEEDEQSPFMADEKPNTIKGQWYVCLVDDYTCFTKGTAYQCTEDGFLMGEDDDTHQAIDEYFRPWNITQDARPGDILQTDRFIFIFDKIDENGNVRYFINYNKDSEEIAVTSEHSVMGNINDTTYSPCDKEANLEFSFNLEYSPYKWNEDKLKVEYLPTFKAGDIIRHNNIEKCLIVLDITTDSYLTSDGQSLDFPEQFDWIKIGTINIVEE